MAWHLWRTIRSEWDLLRLSLLFYTRIPVGHVEYHEERMGESFRYFPLLGAIVGAVMAGIYALAGYYLPNAVAAVMSVIVGLVVTGGMHEDGLSDYCDAFGGYHDRDTTLRIMKDSSTGVYGILGLVMLLMSRVVLLSYIPYETAIGTIVAMAVVARWMPILVMRLSTYARKSDEASKATHLRQVVTTKTLLIAAVWALLALLLLPWQAAVVAPVLMIGQSLLIMRISNKRIGGHTGDVLGAIECLAELMLLLVTLVVTIYV